MSNPRKTYRIVLPDSKSAEDLRSNLDYAIAHDMNFRETHAAFPEWRHEYWRMTSYSTRVAPAGISITVSVTMR